MKCYNCGNEYEPPSRDVSVPGGADFEYCYCMKCDAFLCSVRIDLWIPPHLKGFGWIGGNEPTSEQREELRKARDKSS